MIEWIGEWATVEVTKKLLASASSKLNSSDLDKAIKTATQTAELQQPQLFCRCSPDFIPGFLNNFFQGRGLGELQKPLQNQGIPGTAFLVKAFTKAAQADAKMKEIDESSVKSWMEVFVRTYFQCTDTYLKFQVAKENYFQQIAKCFDNVKFAGIAVPGEEVDKSEQLVNIFVMPDVVEDARENSYSMGEAIPLFAGNQRQQKLLWEQRQRAVFKYSGRKFLASQLLTQSDSQKTVLLGAPGSGKTSLLSYFAVMLAQERGEDLGLKPGVDYLPILMRMRDLARLGDISIFDYIQQFAEKSLSVKKLPEGFFEYWLEDGRAVVLLDGLDEVAESSKRYDVVQRIENFLSQFHHNRAIITSRPAGYKRDFFRTEEFPHYELQAFDDEKIEEFINRWYDSRVRDAGEAERRKDSLRKALEENNRIKLLAQNPLLLTIIALIHRYQAVLPKERYKLYDKAVETLLISWDAHKDVNSHNVLKYLGLDDLRRLMEILAYWIHTQGNTGDREGGTLIDFEELLDKLKREIKTLKRIALYEAEEEGKRFLSLIRERTGLLNEQGTDCYAFVHKTFQEYLCAQEIDYQADNEGDFDIILDHIRQHLHDQHWREVLLLLISQQKPKKAGKAIRAILNNGSEYERWLHRDLFFAGSCLADDPKNLSVADGSLGGEILQRLVELEVGEEEKVGRKVKEEVFLVLRRFYETAFEAQALELLKAEEEKIDKIRLQEYRAEFGEKEKAIAPLILLLQDESTDVYWRAADTLGKFAKDSVEVINPLLKLLQDESSLVPSKTAVVLGKLGNNSDAVINSLLQLLQNQDYLVRSNTAYVLGQLRNDSDEVINSLVQLLHDESYFVRVIAGSALGELGKDSDAVINPLLQLLQDESGLVRMSGAFALGKLGQDSDVVINPLLQLLQDEKISVRWNAAVALGKLGKDSDEVINPLLQLLQDKYNKVRSSAAYALGNLGKDSDEVINPLLQLLQDKYNKVRSSAADALGELGKDSDEVINPLLQLLQDEDSLVRSSAADALGKLGKKSPKILPQITQWLEDNQDYEYVGNGIDALSHIVAGES